MSRTALQATPMRPHGLAGEACGLIRGRFEQFEDSMRSGAVQDMRTAPRCIGRYLLFEAVAAVAANEIIGRAVVIKRRLFRTFELRDDALGERLAEFDAPLVE